MWNIKYGTNPINKTEILTDIENRLVVAKAGVGIDRRTRSFVLVHANYYI